MRELILREKIAEIGLFPGELEYFECSRLTYIREKGIDRILALGLVELADDQEWPTPDPHSYEGESEAIYAAQSAAFAAGFRKVKGERRTEMSKAWEPENPYICFVRPDPQDVFAEGVKAGQRKLLDRWYSFCTEHEPGTLRQCKDCEKCRTELREALE